MTISETAKPSSCPVGHATCLAKAKNITTIDFSSLSCEVRVYGSTSLLCVPDIGY